MYSWSDLFVFHWPWSSRATINVPQEVRCACRKCSRSLRGHCLMINWHVSYNLQFFSHWFSFGDVRCRLTNEESNCKQVEDEGEKRKRISTEARTFLEFLNFEFLSSSCGFHNFSFRFALFFTQFSRIMFISSHKRDFTFLLLEQQPRSKYFHILMEFLFHSQLSHVQDGLASAVIKFGCHLSERKKFNLPPRVSRGPYIHITGGIDDRKTSFKQFFVRNSDLRTAVRELKKSHNGKRSFAGEISLRLCILLWWFEASG